jgi:GNAT superfamily N-acetyltransferase
MSIYWWLHGMLTRRRRAARWASGIRVRTDDSGAAWEVDSKRDELAESRTVRWEELAGVAERPDDGTAPDGLFVLRRGATTADFLPLEAEGVRAFLDTARRRGLVRPLEELIAEREANERALSAGVTIRAAAPEEYERARAAYSTWGYDGGVAPDDVVYLAQHGTDLVGLVRRTREHGVTMLRGMQVAPAWRRRRIGSRLLRTFVEDLHGEECYCVPYTHLISFYGAAGFGAVREDAAPAFLRERLAAYRGRGLDVLIMRRRGG